MVIAWPGKVDIHTYTAGYYSDTELAAFPAFALTSWTRWGKK